MNTRKVLSIFLVLTMIVSVLSIANLAVGAIDVGEKDRFEGESMTLVGTYEDNAFASNTDFSPSGGEWLQYGVTAPATGYIPAFAVFEVVIGTPGIYSLLYAGRHHESGRMMQFSFGKEAGVSEDKLSLDTSSDIIAGLIDTSVFAGGNSNHIAKTVATDSGVAGTAATKFKLSAGTYYFKMLITSAGSKTNNASCRLNIDYVELTLEANQGDPADYTVVERALARVPAILDGIFTPESIAPLNAAIAAIDYEMDNTEQDKANKMASDINHAINNLMLIIPDPELPQTQEFLATDAQDPESSNESFASQGFTGKPNFSRFDGTAIGDFATYKFDVLADGYYEIFLDYRAHESVAKANIDINGARQTATFDSVGTANTANRGSIGKYYLRKGENRLTFTLYAPGSNGSYRLNLFYIQLEPTAAPAAEYSAVEAALARIPAILEGIYMPDTIAALNTAIDAIEYGLSIEDQPRIDQMANDINTAVNNLVKIIPDPEVPEFQQFLGIDAQDSANSNKPFASQGFSGKPNFSRFDGTEADDYATYKINVKASGEYIIFLDYRAHESVGKAYIDINDVRQKATFDSPGSPNTAGRVSIGKYILQKGENVIKFTMFDAGSNGAYRLNIFHIEIKPHEEPIPFVHENGKPLGYWAYNTIDTENSTTDIFGEDFSDEILSIVEATEIGQYASYKLDVPYAGEYKLRIKFRAGEKVGKAKVFVNGEEAFKWFESTGRLEYTYSDTLGYYNFEQGVNNLKFEIVGKDSGRKGYQLELIDFQLIPVNYQYENSNPTYTQLSPAVSNDKIAIGAMYSLSTLSSLYTVKVDGVNVPAITYGNEMDYAEFTMKKGPVTVEVTFNQNISNYTISPLKLGLSGTVNGRTLTFTMERDEYLIIRINSNGRRLILTADPPESETYASSGEGIFNVTEAKYLADPSGKNYSSDSLQRAIDDASAYGSTDGNSAGVVYLPAGVYRTGSTMLRSNVTLYLADGATILGSERHDDWLTKGYKQSIGRAISYLLFTQDGAKNVKITGRGTVDGNAKHFRALGTWLFAIETLAPVNCDGFITDGITYRGSGVWCVVPAWSQNLKFLNFKVYNNIGWGEDDGIDIVGCQNVLIRNSISVSFDDPYSTKTHSQGYEIAGGWGLQAGKNIKNENVWFDDCIAWTGCYGYKVGQGVGADHHNIRFTNSVVYDAAVGFGIHHKRYGGRAYDITFDNIDVENLSGKNEDHKFWFQCFAQNDDKVDTSRVAISDITVKNINIRARSELAPKMIARDATKQGTQSISNIVFENITMYGSTAQMSSMGQMGYTVNPNNPNLANSADKSRGHIYNANNYAISNVTSSKVPAIYYNNSSAGIAAVNDADAFGGVAARFNAGQTAMYNMVEFGEGTQKISYRYASASANAEIEVRLDSANGPIIGRLNADGNNVNTYIEKTANITLTSGIHDIYLVAKNGSIKLDYFDTGLMNYGIAKDVSVIENADFGYNKGVGSIIVKATSTSSTSRVELRLGSPTGKIIGARVIAQIDSVISVEVPITGNVKGVRDLYIVAGYGIDVENVMFFNDGGQHIKGDTDLNGTVTVADIMKLRSDILEYTTCVDDFEREICDVNEDGKVNLKDIIIIRKSLLTGIPL